MDANGPAKIWWQGERHDARRAATLMLLYNNVAKLRHFRGSRVVEK
jgi:hypothetical protein